MLRRCGLRDAMGEFDHFAKSSPSIAPPSTIAEGAKLEPPKLRRALLGFSGGEMRTSMQKDFDAHRPLELDAIAGPIVRRGQRHQRSIRYR